MIVAGKSGRQYWADLWRYRELFYFLAWRDVLVRYKQTAIGVAWSVIRPLLTMLVFTGIFHGAAHFKSPVPGVPYQVLVFAGMLPWQFFANALSESSNSLVTNANMISKVYFPRLIVPTATNLAALVDFGITLGLMFLLMAFYHTPFRPQLLLLAPLVVITFVSSLGPGLLLSALNVKYRDFRYIIPFITQFGLYISPVGFLSSKIPLNWQLLYSLNPMVAIIDGFRWCILGNRFTIRPESFCISLAMNLLLVIVGLWYFRKTERGFADYI